MNITTLCVCLMLSTNLWWVTVCRDIWKCGVMEQWTFTVNTEIAFRQTITLWHVPLELPNPLMEVEIPCQQALPLTTPELAGRQGDLSVEKAQAKLPVLHRKWHHYISNFWAMLWYLGKSSMIEVSFTIVFAQIPQHCPEITGVMMLHPMWCKHHWLDLPLSPSMNPILHWLPRVLATL